MEKPGFQNTVLCPYDKAHTVLKDRMQFHLAKCRKNFPTAEKVECRFNKTHVVNKPEIDFHHKNCADRVVLDRFFIETGDSSCAARELLPVNSAEAPTCNEDWDAEENTVSVLDILKEQAIEKQVLRYLPGTTRSKRKNFRYEERLRYQQLGDNGENPVASKPTYPNMSCSAYMKPDRVELGSLQTVPESTRNRIDDEESNFILIGRGRGRLTPTERQKFLEENFNKIDFKHGKEMASGVTPQVYQTDERSSATNQMNVQNEEEVFDKGNQIFNFPKTEEGFCQFPIPGMRGGRGKKRNK